MISDCTQIPRGRVFGLEDGTFRVMHGKWLDAKPAFGPFPTNREACEFEWHRLHD